MDLGGLLQLPPPFCDPFREMVVHPGVVSRLLWLEGAGFKANTGMCICSENELIDAGRIQLENPACSTGMLYVNSSARLNTAAEAAKSKSEI